jgi:transposase
MKDLGIVRRLFYRDGLSISKIERCTRLTRKTVSKWPNAPERTEPKYQWGIAEGTKIAPFAPLDAIAGTNRSSSVVLPKTHMLPTI